MQTRGDDALQGLAWDLSAFLPAEPNFPDTKPCDLSFELVKRCVVACSCQTNMVSQVPGQAVTGIWLMFCGESQGAEGGAKILWVPGWATTLTLKIGGLPLTATRDDRLEQVPSLAVVRWKRVRVDSKR
jgi:hypothetical protein